MTYILERWNGALRKHQMRSALAPLLQFANPWVGAVAFLVREDAHHFHFHHLYFHFLHQQYERATHEMNNGGGWGRVAFLVKAEAVQIVVSRWKALGRRDNVSHRQWGRASVGTVIVLLFKGEVGVAKRCISHAPTVYSIVISIQKHWELLWPHRERGEETCGKSYESLSQCRVKRVSGCWRILPDCELIFSLFVNNFDHT